jgi:glycosyltransferase involved in cell wall biosynthesis
MRVLIVNATGADESRGGVERGVALAAGALAERGVEAQLLQATTLGRRPPGGLAARVENRALDFLALPNGRFDEIVDWFRPDVVHTHNLPGVTTGVWEAARRRGIPVVHSLHDYYALCPRASLMDRRGQACANHPTCAVRTKRLLRFAGGVSVVTGVSDSIVDAHRSLFPAARFEVLRNPYVAFNDVELRPPAREPMTVGYLGGLTREKGIGELLAAAAQLAHDDRFRFRIAGHGRLTEAVRGQAARLPNLTYDGVVRPGDKRAFIESCDVGVIPSIWAEPGGPTHVLVEWLTAQRPTLVSARGGLAEVSGGGVVPVEPTAAGIAEALRELAEPAAWERALAARRQWDGRAELDGWIERQIELYAELSGRAG